MPRRVAVGAVGTILIAVTTVEMLERIWPGMVAPNALVELEPVGRAVAQHQFVRPVRGDDDRASGDHCRGKRRRHELETVPVSLEAGRARPAPAVHHAAYAAARLAALVRRSGRRLSTEPWFLRFEQKLLEGSPEVLSLLGENPFPNRPPRFVRARLELYTFTRWGSRDWWAREDQGLFCPPLELKSFERARLTANQDVLGP